MKKLSIFLSGMLLVFGMVGVATALPVTVANYTFNDAPGSGLTGYTEGAPASWGKLGDGGVFNPGNWETHSGVSQGVYTGGYDATDLALVYGVDAALGYGVLGQWLGVSPVDMMRYTLSVQAAGRNNNYEDAKFRLALVAGNPLDLTDWVTLAISNEFAPVAGDFQTANLIYSIYTASSLDSTHTVLGINLRVYGASAPDQVLFDNVSLNASRFEVAPVPEPATMFLLGSGLIGVGEFVRRKFRK